MDQECHDRFHSVEERLARQDQRIQNVDSNWRESYDILRRRLDQLEADDTGEKATVQPTPADRVEEYMANSVGWQHPWCVSVNVFGVHVRDDLKSDTRKHLRAMAEAGKLDRIGASLYQWRGEIELEEEPEVYHPTLNPEPKSLPEGYPPPVPGYGGPTRRRRRFDHEDQF